MRRWHEASPVAFVGCQKLSFSPSWITRLGSPIAITVAELGREEETQQVSPKAVLCMLGDPEVAFRGFSQFGWLRTLNISARNCSLNLSVRSKFFNKPES